MIWWFKKKGSAPTKEGAKVRAEAMVARAIIQEQTDKIEAALVRMSQSEAKEDGH